MSEIDSLREDIAEEIDAFTATVDELESTVSAAESAVTSNKLHDTEETAVVERDTVSAQPSAAD